MMATPAKKIAWLDQEDLRAMGVRMAAKPSTSMIVRTDDTTIQEVPAESASLAVVTPKPKLPTNNQSWNEFIDQAIALSAEQNQGHAVLSRVCKTDSKACIMQLAYLLKAAGRDSPPSSKIKMAASADGKCMRAMFPRISETARIGTPAQNIAT
jgi:hypothetical protein